jgi:hypothetical protein
MNKPRKIRRHLQCDRYRCAGWRAFTLLEMLLATTLATVLIGAVLMVLSAVARDRQRLTKLDAGTESSPFLDGLRWDLCNAQTMAGAVDGRSLVLIGHGALDSRTLLPTGRLARVTYRAAEEGKPFHLVREQMLLDDPARPEKWRELVSGDISGLWVIATGTPLANSGGAEIPVPSRVRIHLETSSQAMDESLWIR